MRRTTLVALVAAVLFSFTASAAPAGDENAKKLHVTNKICPLMGDEVLEKHRIEYEGQYVYFCCSGCIDMFKADPAAAIAKMTPEDREAIKKNETCPVTGEEIGASKERVEFEGRLVYFCCGGCKSKFESQHANS